MVCDSCIHVEGEDILCDRCAFRVAETLGVGVNYDVLQRIYVWLQHPLVLLAVSILVLSLVYIMFVGLVKRTVEGGGKKGVEFYEMRHWALKGYRLRRRAEALTQHDRDAEAQQHFQRMGDAYLKAYEFTEEGTEECYAMWAASALGKEMTRKEDMALDWYRALLPQGEEYETNRSASFAAYRMGRIYQDTMRDLAKAIHYYEMANEMYPSGFIWMPDLDSMRSGAWVFQLAGLEYDRAELLYRLMECYEDRGQFSYADEVYDELSFSYPGSEWTALAARPVAK